jgi:phosphotriesterase-related protein
MAVITVTGPVAKEALGLTLAHEHLFLDLRNQFSEFADPEKHRLSHEPVGPAVLDWLQRNPYAVKDNLLLDDLETAVAEAERFQTAGGRTMVDCTSIGIHREPEKLRRLAERTGLNIVAGCGYYTQDTHPCELRNGSVEQIAESMLREFADGIDGTGVRPGVIGEIGTSHPIHPDERKSLLAAAKVQRQTRAALFVHTYPWGQEGLEAARLLMDAGANPAKIVICHSDVEPDRAYIRQLLAAGVMIEFDDFGKEFQPGPEERGFAGGIFVSDAERVAVLRKLVADGFDRQLLITTDICLKCMLHRYGGNGYDHIPRTIRPMMAAAGIPATSIDQILFHNPAALLDT